MIHPAARYYAVYEGRQFVAGFTAEVPMELDEVESLRVATDAELSA